MRSFSLTEIAELIDIKSFCVNTVTGFSIDSRTLKKGDLFFALKGEKVDSHDFLEQVRLKGAAGAVVDISFQGDTDLPLLAVPNVLEALQTLATKVMQQNKAKVIAITGSIGKTTTKEFLLTILKNQYKVFANPASYNSQITLPLNILSANGDEDFLILEMGMTHPGQIAQLVAIAPPDYALLTTIAVQHASNFSDGIIGISREKSSIFTHQATQLGILPCELDCYDEVKSSGHCPKVTFSLKNKNADYYLDLKDDQQILFAEGREFSFNIQLPVKALYHNALAAIVMARKVEMDWDAIQHATALLKLPDMRFQTVFKHNIVFINDAYNANPDSMKAALESLPSPKAGGKRIAVLSEMTELGTYSEMGHALVAETALKNVDFLLCVGKRCEIMKEIWQSNNKPAELFAIREELEKRLKELAQPGDVVLLKGARSWALENILHQFN